MADTKLLHANHESEQNNEEGKPASSLMQQQKNGVFFLQEVLAMNNYHTKHGRVIQPWEIGTMLQGWLEHQGKKQLLNQLNSRLLDTGNKQITFDDIAHLEISLGDILDEQRQEKAEEQLTETNKKGLALFFCERLAHQFSAHEKIQWHRFLTQAKFPQSQATFTNYDAHLQKLHILFDTFLDDLGETRSQEIYTQTYASSISNQEILEGFNRFGITDKSTHNLTNYLLEQNVQEGNRQKEIIVTQQELASSKQFIQHMPVGKTLLEAFPLEKFFKTHPHEHGQKTDTQTLFSVYAQWVKEQNPDVGEALESILTDRGKPELSVKTQAIILSWLSTAQQTFFKQQGGPALLEGMAEGRFATEKLTQQHDDYLAQLYDLNQLHVDIPLNDQIKGTLVFKKKAVSIDRQKINDLNQLAEAIQINWEIDLEKSTLPVAYILPRQTLHLNDAQDTSGKPVRLFPELLYTVTSSQGRVHQGMLALLSEPQGAVGIFSPENYQGYYNGHTDEEPTPNLVIKKDTVKDYTFDLLPGQTMSVSSGSTKGDPWTEFHLMHMEAISSGGAELTDIGGIASAEKLFATPQPSLETQLPKFFASRFIDEADIPQEILALWHQRYPQGAPLPHAWIAQGLIAFNKTYFEKKYGLTITDIPRRINGLELKTWIRQDSKNKALWQDEILPELTSLKAHEVTHRLLTFHGVATDAPLQVKDMTNKIVAIDQETLCGIAEGRYPIEEDEMTQERFVVLPHQTGGTNKVTIKNIEAHIAQKIPGFMFDSIRRLDAKSLDAYEKDESTLADLWETATIDDVHDVSNRILAGINGLQTIATELVKVTKSKGWQDKIIEGNGKVNAAKRALNSTINTLVNNVGTTTQLKKKQDDLVKNFDKMATIVEDYRDLLDGVIKNATLTPAERTRYEQRIDQEGDKVVDMYQAYYDFLKQKANLPEDQRDATLVEERNRIATSYAEKMLEKSQDLTMRWGDLGQQREALLAGGALATDPAVVALDTQREGLANRIACLDTPYQETKGEISTYDSDETIQQEASVDAPTERFKSKFSNLKGDYNAKFENGTVLFLRFSDSQRPGRGSVRIKAELQNTQGAGSTYDLVIKGVTEGSAGERVGKRIPREKSSEDLGKLIAQSKGDVYKFCPNASMESLHTYVTDKLQSSQSKVSDFQSSWNADNVNKSREKKFFDGSKQQRAPITYIGRTFEKHASRGNPESYFYAVEFVGNGVRVTNTADKTSQYLDTESYMMFLLDKNLMPFTDAEYQAAYKKSPEAERRKSHWSDYFVSRKVLTSAVSKFPAAYKHKMEQESKFQSAMLYYRFAKGMGSLGFGDVDLFHMSDILADAEGELDTNISQVIKGYQDRIGRAGEGDNSVHGVKTSELIVREIFSKSSDKTQFRQKAAGYLMYALNSGGAYFRKLAKYNGQGKWVEAILGKSQQAKFLAENRALLDRVRSNPHPSDADLDLVAKNELWFIAKESVEIPEVFGTKFGRNLEDQATDLGQASKAGEMGKIFANKNIYEIYDAFRFGGIGNMTTKTALGALQAMSEKVDDATTYSLFYKSMVQLMATGFVTSLNATGRGVIGEIARKRGIPLGLLAGDPLHPYKIVTLFDAIAQASKEKDPPLLSKHIEDNVRNRNAKNIHANNFSTSQGDVMEAIDGRWEQNGFTAMEALNYKNAYLFEAQEKGTTEQKAIVDDYFSNAVFNGYLDRNASGRDIDGQSPFMENGIWNISPGLFQDILMKTEGVSGEFRSPAAHELRQQVGSMLQQFDGLLSQTQSYEQKKKILQFLLKKFKIYFGNSFNKKDYDGLEGAFVDMKSESDRKGIGYESMIRHKILGEPMLGIRKKLVKDKIVDDYGQIQQKGRKVFGDPIVEETVGTMVDLFETHLGTMSREARSDIVHRVFS